MSRIRSVASLFGLGVARVRGRLRVAPHRVLLSVLGVALAIGLMLSVTGISLGLASQSVVESEDVDYWIVPEGSEAESVVVSSGGLKLGEVHPASRQIASDDRVEFATPVLLTLLPVHDVSTGERTYVLAVGVIPRPGMEILGLPADDLRPGDPHYANGSYDGPRANELVLNDAAAELTNATAGATVTTPRGDGNRTLTVVNVSAGSGGGPSVTGSVPVALTHLSELQSASGAARGDQADQILVSTNDRTVKESLTGRYPRTSVVERSGLSAQQVSTSSLPLAVAVAALVSAVVVGVLFITTLMGLEVNASRRQLGTLAAMGFSRTARSTIIAAETLCLALVGGVVGIGLGALGVVGINTFGETVLGVGTTALFEPLLVVYALAIAVVIGFVGAVYPVLVSFRTTELEGLAP
jgi:putative ABC transport system permease protein